jgi:hypothetical protein
MPMIDSYTFDAMKKKLIACNSNQIRHSLRQITIYTLQQKN